MVCDAYKMVLHEVEADQDRQGRTNAEDEVSSWRKERAMDRR